MKYTVEQMNISHVTTSYYHPQVNPKVERFHRTLHDVMSKRVSENVETWDIYLNQVFAAIGFNSYDSTKFSPFYLLYNCDPLLSKKQRHRHYGEEPHRIGLLQQYKSFDLVQRHLQKAKK